MFHITRGPIITGMFALLHLSSRCFYNRPALMSHLSTMLSNHLNITDCVALSHAVGRVEKYIDEKWQEIPDEDQLKMTKMEVQVWIALYNLLLSENCQQKYEFNNYNKNQLLKVGQNKWKINKTSHCDNVHDHFYDRSD